MNSRKRKKLEARGWRIGSVTDFLDLTQEEEAYIEMKLSLGRALKETRVRKKLTQTDVAQRLHSSQSRVAKMETGDRSVSVDLLIRSLLELGKKPKEIARYMDVKI